MSFSSRAHLQCLDLSGSNRIDDHFICTNCDVAFMQIYRAERLHLSRQQSIQGTPNPAGDIQDYIPTEDLPDAANVFLLQFPHLKTLKLNQLYRLTCRGIKVLTSCFNDAGERVSLRGRLERLELMGNGLGKVVGDWGEGVGAVGCCFYFVAWVLKLYLCCSSHRYLSSLFPPIPTSQRGRHGKSFAQYDFLTSSSIGWSSGYDTRGFRAFALHALSGIS